MLRHCVALLLFLLFPLGCKKASSSAPESIEMLAVLRSQCTTQARANLPKDLLPVRYIYVLIQQNDGGEQVEYREFDGTCRVVTTATSQWTFEQFEAAKKRIKLTGIQSGQSVAPSESSGNDLPVSFLRVHTPEYNIDFYTMYLRFRWTGEMKTEDPGMAKALDEWHALLNQATPAERTRLGITEITKIANNCASDWPPSFRAWICSEARQIVKPQ